ncbi:MAG TPA: energy transducer TonB, partial [Thioalkalivibrio sp.]|nr:energy transducer TonB [Thioalkalivibrio sp.]
AKSRSTRADPLSAPTEAAPAEPVRESGAVAAEESAPTREPRFDAEYLDNPAPTYPRASLRLREEGSVEIRARVGRDGRPRELAVARSSGSMRLDRAALDAIRRWSFEPAQRAGIAVEAWVVVPITFKLEN